MASPEDLWHICVDTGGTFTDCLARDPAGGAHRAKVLSIAALRGRVVQQTSAKRLRIEVYGSGRGVNLAGFSLRTNTDRSWAIIDHNPETGEIELDAQSQCSEGDRIELTTGEPAPILAARIVTGTAGNDALPPLAIRLATTRGTNALLERAGEPVAFFVTKGFGDLLRIGEQQRPDLFALNIAERNPLHEKVVEVKERLAADGEVIVPLDEEHLRESAMVLRDGGIRSAAIALMHSYKHPQHERRVAEILHEIGFDHVAASSDLAPLIEILPRAETTVVEAYLGPIIGAYLQDVADASGQCSQQQNAHGRKPTADSRLHVMTSAGGLVAAHSYRAKDSLLSGPAGGVAGAAEAGRRSGFDRIIGFDMGGTSTDVCRVDGDFEYRFEHTVGGARLVAPALAIETVAAGGGSMCEYRDDRLRVGPRSAGADPGPACYGGGGPLTLTDVNLLAGRLDPKQFEIPIDRHAAERALQVIVEEIDSGERGEDSGQLLDGFLAIANERMAGAIEQISLRKGYDPKDYALVSFGGAGGQHACALANMLNIRTVIMPADASLLSAVGLDAAVVERFVQRQVLARLDAVGKKLADWFKQLAKQAIDEVEQEGMARDAITVRRRIANVRLAGQDATIAVEVDDPEQITEAFAERYQALYGLPPAEKPIEIESIRVVASSQLEAREHKLAEVTEHEATSARTVRSRFDGEWQDVPAYERESLTAGASLDGPALIFDQRSAYVIESGWRARIDAAGAIVSELQHEAQRAADSASEDEGTPEVVRTELFANRFASIAEDMGQILQRTALSTNVKRRLDFSCAVLDADGELVVNAPHIPVHLGAIGLCVRTVAGRIDMQPGDALVTNHPAFGGSHLPDVTVVTPVFVEAKANKSQHQYVNRIADDANADQLNPQSAPVNPVLIGYVANRAHHAELGGSRPGSMPPSARTLAEEGVVIEPLHLVRRGESQFDQIESLLSSGKYPSRAVEDNIADLRAAVAANHRGVTSLQQLAAQYGVDEITQRMQGLKDRSHRLVSVALREFGDGTYKATEELDDGSPLSVRFDITDGKAVIDFTGTAQQHAGNLNATPAIVRSVVLYVLRLLVGERLPLNEGLMQSIDIRIPKGSLLDPTFSDDPAQSPAVVGGNTETSQRLVDTLLKALDLIACSQGTMNNILFGTDRFGYYETVCGGSGAGPDFDGADAVHTHMTNTRITDPEMIEHRYPVRIERFAIRQDSGGSGTHRGGNGITREITFLDAMSLSVLTQHRVVQPYGLHGGEPGACGGQRVHRADGEIITLDSVDQCEVASGDRLVLETPGGGGYGDPARKNW